MLVLEVFGRVKYMSRYFMATTTDKKRSISYSHMRNGSHGRENTYVVDSSFSSTKEHENHSKESRGFSRSKGSRDNTSKIHDDANPR